MQGKLNFDAAIENLPRAPHLTHKIINHESGEEFTLSIRLPESRQQPDASAGKTCTMTPLYARLWALLERYYREPMAVFSSSRTMLLPHQVEAALKVVSASRPRFLIADEVGLGKTIEAGLILKELKLKHGYSKILIVVPSPLTAQWQQELKSKFAEDFTILTGDALRQSSGQVLRRGASTALSDHASTEFMPSEVEVLGHRHSIFEANQQFLVSIDLAKDERYLETFLAQNFDLVIFDEAHRLRRDANTVTQAWHFAHAMSKAVEGFLLLSATPFRGKIEEIFFLIQLIDPDILGPLATFQSQFAEDASLLKDRLSPVVIRRRKIDVGGFTKRFAKTVKIDLARDEREFYERTTEYVKTEFNRALSRGENLKTFIMIVFQKLLDSSPYALMKALEGRRARLEGLYFRVMHEINESEDVREAVREYQDTEGAEEGCGADDILNPQEIRAEIQTLAHLAKLGKQITSDSKFKALQKTLKTMRGMGHEKFVIFTQFKSTLEYLVQNLAGYKVVGFHGGLNFEQKEDAIRKFFAEAEILICTEAGGEGRNLQIAACLINYDLPWSPLKLEQRIGRIHRFGQTRDVHIVNFACRDTVAERVVEVLEEKIRIFENALGPSDTLLGVFESEYKFGRSLMAFLSTKKTRREHNEELERSLFLAKENLRNVDRLISTEHMNFNLGAFKLAHAGEESRTSGEALRELMRDYTQVQKISLYEKNGVTEIASANGAGIQNVRRGTFDHEAATKRVDLEFFAFGHELIDRFAADIVAASEALPIVRVDAAFNGMVFFFAMALELDKKYRRMYRVFIPKHESDTQYETTALERVASAHGWQATELDLGYLHAVAQKAAIRLETEILKDIRQIMAKVRPYESYWHNRIVDAAAHRKAHLEEKLELQRSKVKWYGDKFVGSVSKLAGEKRRSELAAYERLQKSESRVQAKIELVVKKVCVFSAAN